MKDIWHILIRSLIYYKKFILSQVLIIIILSAVITGSLLTGFSVKNSLKESAFKRLGNAKILISSGLRFFDAGLSDRFSSGTGEKSIAVLEVNGFCQNFSSGKVSGKVKIYGIGHDFFTFNGIDTIVLKNGEVAVNELLADRIAVNTGDEIIIRLPEISDLPLSAPFSTAKGDGKSLVMKVGKILSSEECGDFSFGISQIITSNIFINLEELNSHKGAQRVNRLLIENNNDHDLDFFRTNLDRTLELSDLGLKVRSINNEENEIISNRIFIDQILTDRIMAVLPGTFPVITYLANSFGTVTEETPYSFVSSIPSSSDIYNINDDEIIINRWLASDLKVDIGDNISMSWFSPDSINQLIERSRFFTVKNIVEADSFWGDRTLMPDFPGIAESKTCSEWDAGIPIKTYKIRKKDEDYWNVYKGTPKAFISYKEGKSLWTGNFGPATSIRFSDKLKSDEIKEKLSGEFDAESSGFLVRDLYSDIIKAADQSVDFGTLFLSLGFFIIFSSLMLLSLSVSSYFETRSNQVNTLFALGFKDLLINKILFFEALIISVPAVLAGVLLGLFLNTILITALNSVWMGAVQTNTLQPYSGFAPLATGFFSVIIIIASFFYIKTHLLLKNLRRKKEGLFRFPSIKINRRLIFISLTLTLVCLTLSIFTDDHRTIYSFLSGIGLFATFSFLLRHIYISGFKSSFIPFLSGNFHKFNLSHALSPALFIATGIFALFITSSNRTNYDIGDSGNEGGTGGYLFWADLNIPVKEDLSTENGKSIYGLDEDQFKGMSLVQLLKKEGDDASCLNLNHVSSPPLLGIDPQYFIRRSSFSFASIIPRFDGQNPWELLDRTSDKNTLYGIADQTVLDWSLKIKCGDTLKIRAENGKPLNIIIVAGLKSSIFQGHIVVDKKDLKKYFPAISGSSVFLIDGDISSAEIFKNGLQDRFVNYGITMETTSERLAAFYEVTNTYLNVFTILGIFGMILGIFGLGFVLLKNYNHRSQEFAILSAIGYSGKKIRRLLLSDMLIILIAGIFTGVLSAIAATWPTLVNSSGFPWVTLLLMIISIAATGFAVLLFSIRTVSTDSLISKLRKE